MKANLSGQNLKRNRDRYEWYLQKPFKGKFDCSHWWKEAPRNAITPIAALYELIRRHPRVGNLMAFNIAHPIIDEWDESEIYASFKIESSTWLQLTSGCALKSWVDLPHDTQRLWASLATNTKGVNSGLKCLSITENASCDLIMCRGLFDKRMGKNDMRGEVFTSDMDKAISLRAVDQHQRGFLILAFAPDLKVKEAVGLFESEYRRYQKKNPIMKERARPNDWLKLIAQFDDAASSSGGVNSRGFNPYKNVIDSIRI